MSETRRSPTSRASHGPFSATCRDQSDVDRPAEGVGTGREWRSDDRGGLVMRGQVTGWSSDVGSRCRQRELGARGSVRREGGGSGDEPPVTRQPGEHRKVEEFVRPRPRDARAWATRPVRSLRASVYDEATQEQRPHEPHAVAAAERIMA
jgi:hypothetical protein